MPLDEYHRIVESLVATNIWNRRTAAIGLRAGFRCQYCDCDLIESPDRYKARQIDHIIPRSKDGSIDDGENLALSCRECNVDFKKRWDPRSAVGANSSRSELVSAVRQYVSERRSITQAELDNVRKIVGRI